MEGKGKGKAASRAPGGVGGGGDGERRRSSIDALHAFMSEFRPAYKEKRPGAQPSTVIKAASRKWKAMSMEEKDRFYHREKTAAEEHNHDNTGTSRATESPGVITSVRNIPNMCNYPELGPEEWFRSHPDFKLYRTIGGVGPVNIYLTSRHFEYGFFSGC